MAAADALKNLAAELIGEDSLLSACVVEPSETAPLAELIAAGPRGASNPEAYAMIIESVREGYLLHYGSPRILVSDDADLALLAGDYLYAKGLERLAAIGDLEAVRELSDLISLSAQLHADGDSEATVAPAAALWLACALAVTAGPSPAHELGKDEFRRSGDARALFRAAEDAARAAGLDEQLTRAAETVGFAPFHLG